MQPAQQGAVAAAQIQIADRLQRYADGLAASGDVFYAPPPDELDTAWRTLPIATTDDAYAAARRSLRRLVERVDYVLTSAQTEAGETQRNVAFT